MDSVLPLDDLIKYVKPYLKSKGFKKKNRRWTKDIGEFTLCFYIQGSSYSKYAYYVRPGIFVNAFLPTQKVYGHWMTEINQTTPEEIINEFEKWCCEWTNKPLIRERLEAYLEWEKRTAMNKIDYASDPNPAPEFLLVTRFTPPTEPSLFQYILDHY